MTLLAHSACLLFSAPPNVSFTSIDNAHYREVERNCLGTPVTHGLNIKLAEKV